jgi:protease PrsW
MSQVAERERWLSGVPSGIRRPWWQRCLRSPLFWLSVVLLPLYAFFLYDQWAMFTTSQQFEDGTETLAFTTETVKRAAALAAPTAIVYVLLFIWLDRFRGQNPLVWLLAFGWGAAASTWFSIHINTWMGEQMATTAADADMGSRAAIFSAPFSEEATKATVLFLLIILMRRHIVSRLNVVMLSGLSAIGFAFTENIIYYGRVITYAVNNISVANPDEAVMELVLMRGVYTSFGHPLFTMLTATGLVVGLSARSRIVRIVAPLGGFLLSVAGHMLFNGLASTRSTDQLKPHWIMALILVALIVASLVISVVQQGRLVRHRLSDYVAGGWLTERDVQLFGGPLRRANYLLKSVFWGPRRWWYTARLVRRMTELAYLRSEVTRGLTGEGGHLRGHDILGEIEELRPKALATEPDVRWLGWRKRKSIAAPGLPQAQYPGPAGLGGNWPAR